MSRLGRTNTEKQADGANIHFCGSFHMLVKADILLEVSTCPKDYSEIKSLLNQLALGNSLWMKPGLTRRFFLLQRGVRLLSLQRLP